MTVEDERTENIEQIQKCSKDHHLQINVMLNLRKGEERRGGVRLICHQMRN